MRETNQLLELVKTLSDKEQKKLVSQIMEMMKQPKDLAESKSASCNNMVTEHVGEHPNCPHCNARADLGYVVKHGKKNGVQRYLCKSCGRHFMPTTNTAFEHTRKNSSVWEKFIYMTISGATLHECSEQCSIAFQTAFTWRHKILNVFRTNQDSTMMTGQIQLDEMLIPISFKGNHMQGSFHEHGVVYADTDNAMPRKAYKRGSDNKSRTSKDKACVFCMIEDGVKSFYAAVPGTGFMLPNMLDNTFAKHVAKEKALIVADQYKVTANYLKENGYDYMTLAANTSDNPQEHKPEIRGKNHLQHVNAMHHYIRLFLANYHGVATKYLENYVSLFVWIKNVAANKQKRKLQKISLCRAATADCYISRKDIESFPMIPSVA